MRTKNVYFMTSIVILLLVTLSAKIYKGMENYPPVVDSYNKLIESQNVSFMMKLRSVLNKKTDCICILSSIVNVATISVLFLHLGRKIDTYFVCISTLVSYIIYGKVIDYYRWHILACGAKYNKEGKQMYGLVTQNKELDKKVIRAIHDMKKNG